MLQHIHLLSRSFMSFIVTFFNWRTQHYIAQWLFPSVQFSVWSICILPSLLRRSLTSNVFHLRVHTMSLKLEPNERCCLFSLQCFCFLFDLLTFTDRHPCHVAVTLSAKWLVKALSINETLGLSIIIFLRNFYETLFHTKSTRNIFWTHCFYRFLFVVQFILLPSFQEKIVDFLE